MQSPPSHKSAAMQSGFLIVILAVLALVPAVDGLAIYLRPEWGPHRPLMLFFLWAVVVFLTALAATRQIALAMPGKTVALAGTVLIAVWFASSRLNAPSEYWATNYLARNLALLLVGWLLYSAYVARSAAQKRLVVVALLVGSTLHILLSMVVIAIEAGNPEYDWDSFYVGVTHTRHLSYRAMIQIALAAGLFATSRQGRERWIYAGALLFGLYFACLVGGRSVIVIGTLVAIACAVLGNPKLRRQNLLVVVALAIAAVPLSLIYVPPDPHWGVIRLQLGYYGQSGEGEVAQGRVILWKRALGLIAEHPWIGYGEGQFGRLADVKWRVHHPHSAPLQFLVAWGVIGTLAAFTLFANAVLAGFKSILAKREVILAPAALVVGIGTVSLIDGPFFYAYPAMVFVIACAMIKASADQPSA